MDKNYFNIKKVMEKFFSCKIKKQKLCIHFFFLRISFSINRKNVKQTICQEKMRSWIILTG